MNDIYIQFGVKLKFGRELGELKFIKLTPYLVPTKELTLNEVYWVKWDVFIDL